MTVLLYILVVLGIVLEIVLIVTAVDNLVQYHKLSASLSTDSKSDDPNITFTHTNYSGEDRYLYQEEE